MLLTQVRGKGIVPSTVAFTLTKMALITTETLPFSHYIAVHKVDSHYRQLGQNKPRGSTRGYKRGLVPRLNAREKKLPGDLGTTYTVHIVQRKSSFFILQFSLALPSWKDRAPFLLSYSASPLFIPSCI